MTKRVTHLIVGLGKGGAETMLYQILKYRSSSDIAYSVVSLGASHYFEEPIRELGIDVTVLQFKGKPIASLIRLFKIARQTDTLCCWMYHANLIGYYIGRLAGVKRIVWCIRHSSLDEKLNKKRTLRINRFCARLSKNIATIAYNGENARKVHEAIGYCKDKGIILDNGCDCEEYAPSANAGIELRQEIGISGDKRIVLSVTKDHPIKDVPTFIRAFAMLHSKCPNIVAVMCGSGIEPGNERISLLCQENGLTIGSDIFLLGMRHDVPHLLAACDLYVLHSAGEAFPNTLVQAMACGCLCVATDVGDVARIILDSECMVPSGNIPILAEKMNDMFLLSADEKAIKSKKNRQRIVSLFNIYEIVRCYEKIYKHTQ